MEPRDVRHGEMQPHDASRLRISDADRHQVSEVLRNAAGEGRLELDELEERLEATFAAKTYADLAPITADLPGQAVSRPAATHPPTPATPAGPSYGSSVAIMSETKRVGPWQVADGHTAFALMGSVTLDLREARFEAPEITVNAHAIMGEVKVLVSASTMVVVDGVGIMGEFKEQRARVDPDPGPGSTVVRVKGIALMGSVHVQRRPMPGETRRRLTGRR